MTPLQAIRRSDRLLDTALLTLNAGVVMGGFAVTLGAAAGLLAFAATTATGTLLTRSRRPGRIPPAASDRGRQLCRYFCQLADLPPLAYAEGPLNGHIGRNLGHTLLINDRFASRASTGALGAVIGHEIGHKLYGRLTGHLGKYMTLSAAAGTLTVLAAMPWLGIGTALASAGIMMASGTGSFLLSQMQQRHEEFVCDRIGTTLAGSDNLKHSLQQRSQYSDPGLTDRWLHRCRPGSLAEQAVNLLQTHPPTRVRRQAVDIFARHFDPGQDQTVSAHLSQQFDALSRTRIQSAHPVRSLHI